MLVQLLGHSRHTNVAAPADARIHPRWWAWITGVKCLLPVIAIILAWLPHGSLASPPTTPTRDVLETGQFTFWFDPADRRLAERHAAFADDVLAEMTAIFKAPTEQHISVYLHHSVEEYQQAHPNADPATPGTADVAAGQISLFAPTVAPWGEFELENNFRHLVSLLLIGQISGERLPTALAEGTALYLEHPGDQIRDLVARLSTAAEAGQLLSWQELTTRAPGTGEDEILRAEGYAVVAFLIDRWGIDRFRDYLRALGASQVQSASPQPDPLTVLKQVYGQPVADIERAWQDQLPQFVQGGWQTNHLQSADLNTARQLLAAGKYAEARDALQQAEEFFKTLGNTERVWRTRSLIRRAEAGLQAEQLMTELQAALDRNDYERAGWLLHLVKEQYARLPVEQRPVDRLRGYEEMVEAGRTASQQLEHARALAANWQLRSARQTAIAAAHAFAAMGDSEMASRAQEVIDRLYLKQRRLAHGVASIALLVVALIVIRQQNQSSSDRLDWS